jgi:hypothetical protein
MHECMPNVVVQARKELFGVSDLQHCLGCCRREPGTGFGMAVGILDIRFYVEYRGAVNEVGTGDDEHGTWLNAQQTN